MAPQVPKGFEQLAFPTRGGKSADIYNQLGGDTFQRLLSMSQNPEMAGHEKYAMDVFNQQIAPNIASRYAGSGIGASSGMQNAIAGAGGNLANYLQSQRSNLMHQSMQDVLSLGDLLLSRPDVEMKYRENQGTDWTRLLSSATGGIGGIAKEFFSPSKELEGGKKGIDWGSIGSGVADMIPMMLKLIGI